MQEFWMVAKTFPDVAGAQPQVIGPPCWTFKDACEEAKRAHTLEDHCPVVVLHTVAIVESEGIPSTAEAMRRWKKTFSKPKKDKS